MFDVQFRMMASYASHTYKLYITTKLLYGFLRKITLSVSDSQLEEAQISALQIEAVEARPTLYT